MKKIILLTLFLCGGIAGYGQQRDSNVYVYRGDAAPLFEASDMKGTKISSKDFNGRYTLVVFFATWCPHCQHELPELQKVYEQYGSRNDFNIVPISNKEIPDSVAAYFRHNGYTMPFYVDHSGDALRKFARGGIPRTFLINKDGTVIETVTGYSFDEKTGMSNFSIITNRLRQILR